MSDLLDNSTNVVIGLIVAVILICSALIPITLEQMASLTDLSEEGLGDVSTYQTLIEVVLVLAIIGMIIGVVRTYNKTERD